MSPMHASSLSATVVDCSPYFVPEGVSMHRAALCVATLLMAFAATRCADEAEKKTSAPPELEAQAIAAQRPDPGPLLEHDTGHGAVETLGPLEVTADARATIDGHVYVRVAYPANIEAALVGRTGTARLLVDGPGYALAVPASQGRLPDRPWLLLQHARAKFFQLSS